ncbi:Methyltransferase domain-containing protein [Arboricoccus pini]|uniref:Methyltransferase domain-containing protein n=1 Tax=Arboricoccus pini TaxID=1963835 RepID=A0A212Q2Q4_9PROT|nr:methyltransferase domain-containing protein [Arboricoccus pini]SNB53489.1 Methyltransferase domain-containing protein [Arboricoccus pini]
MRRSRLEAPAATDFLRPELAARLAERFADIARPTERVLELGSTHGILRHALAAIGRLPPVLIESDLTSATLEKQGCCLVLDEERLPFKPASFDAVLSVMALHKLNDLPGALSQIRLCLRPGGFFLAALPGGDTLHELRFALAQAELASSGGAAARVHPSIDVRDMGALMQRAGFALPMADLDRIDVTYPDVLALIRDLRAMAETSLLVQAKDQPPLNRALLQATQSAYVANFGLATGRLPASFDILFVIGWQPD